MDDRELLKLAAKAANYPVEVRIDRVEISHMGKVLVDRFAGESYFYLYGEPWNPLENDGDALRLAVKLNLSIHQHQHGAGWVDVGPIKILTGGDPYAATRRAIVRAAAEIGKQLDK